MVAKRRCAPVEPVSVPEHLEGLIATATRAGGLRGITIDFAGHPLPAYEGRPRSHWGEGLVASNGRYDTAVGDDLGVDGNVYLYEYDPVSRNAARGGGCPDGVP